MKLRKWGQSAIIRNLRLCSAVPQNHAVYLRETKRNGNHRESKRNETELLRLVSHPGTKRKTTPMRRFETETEMGEKDSEAPFRFDRNFSVLSVTLAVTRRQSPLCW